MPSNLDSRGATKLPIALTTHLAGTVLSPYGERPDVCVLYPFARRHRMR
ncbi:MAG: hypothetical protein P4L48_10015 [Mycobacterium sp.]|nr:hypothetical protein [Mycobacterium sp.]